MPAAHRDLAISCIVAAVHHQLPLHTPAHPWLPRRHDPLTLTLAVIVGSVTALDLAAVEIASVLLDDGFEGSFEQLFTAAPALTTG